MKRNWRRISMGLVFVAAFATFGAGCVVHARGSAGVTVVDRRPPPPRYVKVKVRPGKVWVRGRWVWRGGRWVWKSGYYVTARSGKRWEPGYWEQRGNRWHWVEGRWVVHSRPVRVERRPRTVDHRRDRPRTVDHRRSGGVAPAQYPSEAPPAPRYQTPAPRAGYVWVRGHYEWRGGRYVWRAGHWERARSGKRWEPGHWERKGSHYVWVEGRWVVGPAKGPRVIDHRKKKTEDGRDNTRVPARRGTPKY